MGVLLGLRGRIKWTNYIGGGLNFALLPEGYRPDGALNFVALTVSKDAIDGNSATLRIYDNGIIQLINPTWAVQQSDSCRIDCVIML